MTRGLPLLSLGCRYIRGQPRRGMRRSRRSADSLEILGGSLAAGTVGDQLELDLLAFRQMGHAGALDGADVHECVLAAVIRRNEAEALGAVEPLNRSRSHGKYLSNVDMLTRQSEAGPSNLHCFGSRVGGWGQL